jgi:hypothetical protein
MAPVKLRPQDVSLIMPEPATAPVATRAWCVRDPRAPEDDQADLQPAGAGNRHNVQGAFSRFKLNASRRRQP